MVTNPQIPASRSIQAPQRLEVPVGPKPYEILIGTGWWPRVAESVLSVVADATHLVVIYDEAIQSLWSDALAESFRAAGLRVDYVPVPTGETSKSVGQLEKLWRQMLDCRTDRQSVVVAVGGGVIGDLAGFAAATFNRGVRLIQIPTTLLAQVDSSVGGKTGINLPGAKNVVGAFWQPSLVVIDTATLSTLDDRIYLSGLAEVVKYGVIADAGFFAWLESVADRLVHRDSAVLREAIARSCQIKADVVAADERETTGLRAILNYGHTFAHAIEATAGYGHFLHGEAVAVGMQMAADLAFDMGRVDADFVARQAALLEKLDLPIHWHEADPSAMLPVMQSDKKVAHGQLRFILPTKLGHVEMVEGVLKEQVRAAIRSCKD